MPNERFVAPCRSVGHFAPQPGDRLVLGVEHCADPALYDKRDPRVADRPQFLHAGRLHPVLRPAPDRAGITCPAQPRLASASRRAGGHIHHDGHSQRYFLFCKKIHSIPSDKDIMKHTK